MNRRRSIRSSLASFALLLGLLMPAPAPAVEPDEILPDPVLEDRARELSKVIRCLVCQNESIDSSNADLARELRILVRERLTAGDSDAEVLDFLVARYGEFVLLRPRMTPANYLLWFGPAVLLMFGIAGIALYFKHRRSGASAAGSAGLSAEEEAHIARLIYRNPDH